jgi:hypothetical protein
MLIDNATIGPLEMWPVHTAPVVADHLITQGWARLADGTIVFDDGGDIEPEGWTVPAHGSEAPHRIGGAR